MAAFIPSISTLVQKKAIDGNSNFERLRFVVSIILIAAKNDPGAPGLGFVQEGDAIV